MQQYKRETVKYQWSEVNIQIRTIYTSYFYNTFRHTVIQLSRLNAIIWSTIGFRCSSIILFDNNLVGRSSQPRIRRKLGKVFATA